jgi:hypothetical protein
MDMIADMFGICINWSVSPLLSTSNSWKQNLLRGSVMASHIRVEPTFNIMSQGKKYYIPEVDTTRTSSIFLLRRRNADTCMTTRPSIWKPSSSRKSVLSSIEKHQKVRFALALQFWGQNVIYCTRTNSSCCPVPIPVYLLESSVVWWLNHLVVSHTLCYRAVVKFGARCGLVYNMNQIKSLIL